ncbi:MAG: hypothetical protein HY698_01290 [Deltaproteobacteria bacterium]|nr:hypothetical protein [Deltaproteobacteria bacterium]
MHRSARKGEDYLERLLSSGLVSAPGQELNRQARAGAKQKKRFLRASLAVVMFLLIGTATGVSYRSYRSWKTDSAVRRHLSAASVHMTSGTLDGSRAAAREAERALMLQPNNPAALAQLASARVLAWLLYGERAGVDMILGGPLPRTGPNDDAERHLAIARAAIPLARILSERSAPPAPSTVNQYLREARLEIDAALGRWPGEPWLGILSGLEHQLAGDRHAARNDLETLLNRGAKSPLAAALLGDILNDDGAHEDALDAHERALEWERGHPLALCGRALTRIDQRLELDKALDDLEVGIPDQAGPLLLACKRIGLGLIRLAVEDPQKAGLALDEAERALAMQATPRILARLALARVAQGKIAAAQAIFAGLNGHPAFPVEHPLHAILAAELALARGDPGEASRLLEGVHGLVAMGARGRALLDQGRPAAALRELSLVLGAAPGDKWASVFGELCKVHVRAPRIREESAQVARALAPLNQLARASVSTLPRFALGEAYLVLADRQAARRELMASVDESNPLRYRALTRLAEILVSESSPEHSEAIKWLREALAVAPGYAPALAALKELGAHAGPN